MAIEIRLDVNHHLNRPAAGPMDRILHIGRDVMGFDNREASIDEYMQLDERLATDTARPQVMPSARSIDGIDRSPYSVDLLATKAALGEFV